MRIVCAPLGNPSVPPNIVDSGTTDGVVAREGSNVSLSCKATGHPEPNITWKREDGLEFIHNGHPGNKHAFKNPGFN